jgi:hypothetical protein
MWAQHWSADKDEEDWYFSAEDVITMADANMQVDEQPFPRSYHMAPRLLLGIDRRQYYIDRFLDEAVQAGKVGETDVAMKNLGWGLHVIQDRIAHGPWWFFGIHWFKHFDDPYKTYWGREDVSQKRLERCQIETQAYLYAYLYFMGKEPIREEPQKWLGYGHYDLMQIARGKKRA